MQKKESVYEVQAKTITDISEIIGDFATEAELTKKIQDQANEIRALKSSLSKVRKQIDAQPKGGAPYVDVSGITRVPIMIGLQQDWYSSFETMAKDMGMSIGDYLTAFVHQAITAHYNG